VLREKLEESTEKKDDKMVLKLEVDVSLTVMDIFLTFIYSGKLKDIREGDGVDPTWVQMLPQLVEMAHEVSKV